MTKQRKFNKQQYDSFFKGKPELYFSPGLTKEEEGNCFAETSILDWTKDMLFFLCLCLCMSQQTQQRVHMYEVHFPGGMLSACTMQGGKIRA